MVRNKFCFLDSTLQPLGTVGTFPLLAEKQFHLVLCELTSIAEACKLQRLNKCNLASFPHTEVHPYVDNLDTMSGMQQQA